MCKMLNLLGLKKGQIEVIKYMGQKGKKNRHYWVIKCNCGNEKEVLDSFILNGGHDINCGCVAKRRRLETLAENKRKKRGLSLELLESKDEFDALKYILINTNANLKQAKEIYNKWRKAYVKRYKFDLDNLLKEMKVNKV